MEKSLSKIVEFNNAGVDAMMMNEPGVAWHLFKGAVELKVSTQLNATTPYSVLVTANSFVSIAEALVAQQQNHNVLPQQVASMITPNNNDAIVVGSSLPAVGKTMLDPPPPADGRSSLCIQRQSPTSKMCHECQTSETDQNAHYYTAGLITRSCKLGPQPKTIESVSGAFLVFNMAILEHLFQAVNGQPVVLYHLAASLLDQAKSTDQFLYLVILNNTGAFYWENDMIDSAQSTMRQLSIMLSKTTARKGEDQQVLSNINDVEALETMRRNIRNILSQPRLMGSAA